MPTIITRGMLGAYNWLREYTLRQEFKRFYEQLPDKSDIIYMFFPSEILHWVSLATSFVPEGVNLVLIGSGLTAEEQRWFATRRTLRPTFSTSRQFDHNTIWEMLFDTNANSFGVIDSDLFILNPQVFQDIVKIPADACLGCAYSYTAPGGAPVLNTHAIFVNVPVLQAVRRKGYLTTPCTYNYSGNEIGRHIAHALSHRPSGPEIELLKSKLPCGDTGLPVYPSSREDKFNYRCFDTLVMYQLVANALGYPLHHIRNLSGISASLGHYSSEMLHVNGVAYYKNFKHEKDPRFISFYRLILQMDFLVLSFLRETEEVPPTYVEKYAELRRDLSEAGIAEEACAGSIISYFETKGISRDAFAHPLWSRMWQGAASLLSQ